MDKTTYRPAVLRLTSAALVIASAWIVGRELGAGLDQALWPAAAFAVIGSIGAAVAAHAPIRARGRR
jgi:hypothetical protein